MQGSMNIKKIEIAKYLITENIKIFKCPICSEDMLLKENSLVCLNNHCFDLSRKGCINFLINPASSKYDRQMFYSRKYIIENNFFQPLIY